MKDYGDTTKGLKEWYDREMYQDRSTPISSQEPWEMRYASRVLDHLGVTPDLCLLDVACGSGRLLSEALGRGLSCVGLDFSVNATTTARGLLERNIKIIVADGQHLPFANSIFDVVTCLGSLEHFPDMKIALLEMYRVGKEACRYCIIVPNSNYPLHRIGYRTTLQPLNQMNSMRRWKHLFETAGFRIEKTFADNRHLLHPNASSSSKRVLKRFLKPIVLLTPVSLAYQIGFILTKGLNPPTR